MSSVGIVKQFEQDSKMAQLLSAVVFLIFASLLRPTHTRVYQSELDYPTKVSIYYEALCPDSVNFIKQQFYPAYKLLRRSLLVEFVPYGKAHHKNINGRWMFKAQHGPMEAWGNRVQACALVQGKGQDAEVEFVNCFMKSPNERGAFTCSNLAGMSYPKLRSCFQSTFGDNLLALHGTRTKQALPSLRYVPTIVFNDVPNAHLDQRARENFYQTAVQVVRGYSYYPRQSNFLPQDHVGRPFPGVFYSFIR